MIAGFLATTNAGRVALARAAGNPPVRERLLALAAGLVMVVAAAVFAGDLLDALDISPELVWPRPSPGAPFAAVLLTPELVCVALSFGADESTARTLAAAAPAFALVVVAALADRVRPGPVPVQLLAALQIVVAVALGVSGVRDV